MVKVVGFGRQKARVARVAKRIHMQLGIEVEVMLRKSRLTRPHLYGFAYYYAGKHGVMIFKDCPLDMLDEVVAHELVHVWQTVRGDLQFDEVSQTFWWQGDMWAPDRLASVDYYARPWEAEAKYLQKKLAK